MNPLTNMRNLAKINEKELAAGVAGKDSSWHQKYKDSAWIFIGGLPYTLTEGDVICVFSQYGEVVNINLIRDQKTGKSKGFAFMCYEDQRSTILAVDNLNGTKVAGRLIRVDHVEQYKVPKLKDDMDLERRQILEEGCAPKPMVVGGEKSGSEGSEGNLSPKSESSSSEGKNRRKKKKKEKKHRKKEKREKDGKSKEKRDRKSKEKKLKVKKEPNDDLMPLEKTPERLPKIPTETQPTLRLSKDSAPDWKFEGPPGGAGAQLSIPEQRRMEFYNKDVGKRWFSFLKKKEERMIEQGKMVRPEEHQKTWNPNEEVYVAKRFKRD